MNAKIRLFFSNNLIWILLIILVLHIVILSLYIRAHNDIENYHQNNKTYFLLAGLIINSSQFISRNELQNAINIFNHYDLEYNNHELLVTIDPQPKYTLRFDSNNSWQAIRNIMQDNTLKGFSYQFKNGEWLNYVEAHNYKSYKFAGLLILLEIIIILVILLYSYSLQRFIVPLNHFKKSADRLGIDINAFPIKVYGPKIVRETASAMNKMQNRIVDLVQTRTKMLAAISHDLRTPITRLKLRVQFLQNDEQAEKIIQDLNEMEIMINGVLTFSGEDVMHEKKTVFDVNSLLNSICEEFVDQGHQIQISTNDKRIPFLGSQIALKRSLTNVIQNALKYAGEVWVKFNYLSDKITIIIEDNGPGIPEDALTKVFEPYFRVGNPILQSNPGTGLGLTIANEVIRAHSGTITLQNREEGGLQVVIILPA